MRIIFAGTPDFAAAALKRLIEEGHDIAMVLSQPDRRSGSGMKLTASPVKTLALEHGLPVMTPLTLSAKKAPEEAPKIWAELKALGADVLVVAAYGLILPEAVLNCAKGIGRNGDLRAVNIHGSLLPRWRGAAPVARAIEAGDAETGVTLMKMEKGLDTGPMICVRKTPILPEDTSDTLMKRLAEIGADLTAEALRHPGELTAQPQPEEGATYAEKLLKSEAPIDFSLPAEALVHRIHAFNPFPGSTFEHGGVTVKIWNARSAEGSGSPGEVLEAAHGRLVIACGSGALEALVLQKPGKPRMDAGPFLQSMPFKAGEVLK
jgi:methionyl-tRNA formyltransferase